MNRILLTLSGFLLLAPVLLTAQRPLEEPFRVNVRSEAAHQSPRVATNRSGEFVVIWVGDLQRTHDGIEFARLYARRFGADGRPVTGEIRVADGVMPFAYTSAAAIMDDGSFAVAFNRWNETPLGTTAALRIRWFTPEGALDGEAAVIHGPAEMVGMATAGDGGVVLAWSRAAGTGWSPVMARAYGSDRAPLGPTVVVDPSGVRASIAAARDGSFVVAWQNLTPAHNHEESRSRISLRRFAPDGSPAGEILDATGIFRNENGEDPLLAVFVGVDADGNILVVWSQIFGSSEPRAPFGRWYSAEGTPLSRTFPIAWNETSAWPEAFAMGERGNFVLAWSRLDVGSTNNDIFVRRYSRDGSPLGPVLRANEKNRSSLRFLAQVGILAEGGFVVVWQDNERNRKFDIFARRFRRR